MMSVVNIQYIPPLTDLTKLVEGTYVYEKAAKATIQREEILLLSLTPKVLLVQQNSQGERKKVFQVIKKLVESLEKRERERERKR